MSRTKDRRNMAMKSILIALGFASALAMPAAAQDFGPPELIAAAKQEGRLVYYTANFAEVEQEVIKAFNKRFPEIRVEMVRAPGGQLITRVKTEAAAGKLSADVVDHSDRALMTDLVGLFQDYAPPNGKDYLPEAMISPKLWPRATLVWSIAYNSALVKKPPKSWMDLTKPEYGNKQIGGSSRLRAARPGRASCSSGRCWARIIGKSRQRPTPCSIPQERRCRIRSCAERLRWVRCSTTSSTRRRRTAPRWRSSLRPRAPRSIHMPAAYHRLRRTRTLRSFSSTGAYRRKAKPS